MTSQCLKSVFRQYQDKLDERYPTKPKQQMTEDEMGDLSLKVSFDSIVGHCKFMCIEAWRLVDDGQVEKAMRWLGFLQGILWSIGLFTLSELKEHCRPKSVE